MKYLLITVLLVINLFAIDDSLIHFKDSLDKTYIKNKTFLNFKPENMENNIKYFILPNIREYTNNWHTFFKNIDHKDSEFLDELLYGNSKFNMFVVWMNIYIQYLQKENLNQVESDNFYGLLKIHLLTIRGIENSAQNLEQFKSPIIHLKTFLQLAINSNDSESCKIIPEHLIFSFFTRFILLSNEEYKYLEGTFNGKNSLITLEKLAPLISKKDITKNMYEFLEKESSKIAYKQNKVLKKHILIALKNLDYQFSFFKSYVDILKKERKKLEDLEEKYTKSNVDLNKIKSLYSQMFANLSMLNSVKIFKEIINLNNVYRKTKKECLSLK